MRLRAWAPRAAKVEIELAGKRRLAECEAGGWWGLDVDAGPGSDYFFRLDDGEPLPDPRSAWQPQGPLGPSRIVDHAAFAWTDQNWQAKPLSSAVIYELHVGTFTPEGTFKAIVSRLEHLVDLGATHIEIMPIADFPGTRGWGYDGVDLYAPFHHYGTPDDLKQLVDACHRAGLAVLLDVVYNHMGPSGNFLSRFGPYFSELHHTAWGPAVNYDGSGSDEVRRFFCDNALMWLRDYHFDGLRLDAVQTIMDTSAFPFLEQLAVEVECLQAHLGRHLVVIAETDANDPRLVRSRESGGFGLDAHWSDDFHHALHAALTGENLGYYADFGRIAQLATVMTRPYVYAGCHSRYRDRAHGRSAENLSAHRFVVCLQNHDQVGNRARGDRINHGVSPDRAKIGAALVLLSPYVPMLFQGQEWNATSPFQYFVDFSDEPSLSRAVSEGRRKDFARFGWRPDEVPDPQSLETFDRSKLNWRELCGAEHAAMLDWHRRLIGLRRDVPALSDGRLPLVETDFSESARWLVVRRGPMAIACNFAAQEQAVPLGTMRPATIVLSSKQECRIAGESAMLPGESVAVFA